MLPAEWGVQNSLESLLKHLVHAWDLFQSLEWAASGVYIPFLLWHGNRGGKTTQNDSDRSKNIIGMDVLGIAADQQVWLESNFESWQIGECSWPINGCGQPIDEHSFNQLTNLSQSGSVDSSLSWSAPNLILHKHPKGLCSMQYAKMAQLDRNQVGYTKNRCIICIMHYRHMHYRHFNCISVCLPAIRNIQSRVIDVTQSLCS